MRPVLYDKLEVAAHFGRAAQRYSQLADVQRHTGQALLGLLHSYLQCSDQGTVMDLGCGPGIFSPELSELGSHYTGVDISSAMLAQARHMNPKQAFVLGDMENLPFPQDAISLIYSNLAVQWANSLPTLCSEAWRTLQPGGCFAFTTVLPNSLMPLAQLRADYEKARHSGNIQKCAGIENTPCGGVNDHRSFQEWFSALEAQGFTVVHSETRKVTGYFPDVSSLIRSVSGIGADYQAVPQRGLTRSELAYLERAYASHRMSDGLPLEYNVGFYIANKSMQ